MAAASPTDTSPERAQRCNQLWLDPILLERARSFACVQIRYRCRCKSLVEEGGRVVATLRDAASGEASIVAAHYVVDCSGGHSAIRDALGIGMSGASRIEYNLSVFVRAPELWTHHDKGKAALISFVDEHGIWRNLVLLDGRELYRFAVTGKEFYDEPDKADLEALFAAAVGTEVPHAFLSVRRWSARDVVADRYGTDRIFLAGDAAHLNNPSGGFGLNTGLGDVVDLGWKLEAVVRGWGGTGLLPSYAIERRPVAARNVGAAARARSDDRDRRSHKEIAADTADGRRARKAMGEQIVKSQTSKYISDGIALGYRYEGSPICWPDGTQASPDSAEVYRPSARPGGRAPHAWLGAGRSIIDLYGKGFALLRFGDDGAATDRIAAAFAARNVPLVVHSIADPAIHALYERELVLVRPDGHVAWRGDQPPPDPGALADRVRGA